MRPLSNPLSSLFKPITPRTSVIERGLILTSLFSAAVLAAMAVLVHQVNQDALLAGKRAIRADEVESTLDKLQLALRDGEVSQRDYMAAGRRADRDRVEAARFRARLHMAALSPLTGDVPAQAERLARIEPLVNRKFLQLARAVDVRESRGENRGVEPAPRGLEADGVRATTEEIDGLIGAMQTEEGERIKTARAVQREAGERSLVVMVGALALLALLSLVFFLLLKIEFSARRALERRLIESATMDELTGAANRREFDRQLAQEWAFKKRYGTALSLIVLDVDHFKNINDRWGHLAGDAVLREMARRIRTRLRTTETLARYGGEEFAVIVPQYLNDALQLAEQLRERISEDPFIVSEGASHLSIRLTISLGVAEASDVESARELLAAADEAMYAAKENGRNRVETHRAHQPSRLMTAVTLQGATVTNA